MLFYVSLFAKIDDHVTHLSSAVYLSPKYTCKPGALILLLLLQNADATTTELLSLTYKVLTTHQPRYLHNLITVQPCHNIRFSSMVTLTRPPTRSLTENH